MVDTGIWQRFALLGVLNRRFVSDFASVLGFFNTLLEDRGGQFAAVGGHRGVLVTQ